MNVPKWLEDVGHGFLGFAFPAVLLWAREWTRVRLPWPFKGQWPPGDPFNVVKADGWNGKVTQLDRVADIGRDTLGYAIGQDLRTALLVGMVVWTWHGWSEAIEGWKASNAGWREAQGIARECLETPRVDPDP